MKRNLLVVLVVLLIGICTLSLVNLPKTQSAPRSESEHQLYTTSGSSTPLPESTMTPYPESSPSPSPQSSPSPSPQLSPSPSPEPSPETCSTLSPDDMLALEEGLITPEVEASPEASPEPSTEPSPEASPAPAADPCQTGPDEDTLAQQLADKQRALQRARDDQQRATDRYNWAREQYRRGYMSLDSLWGEYEDYLRALDTIAKLQAEADELQARINACNAQQSNDARAKCQAELAALRAKKAKDDVAARMAQRAYERAKRRRQDLERMRQRLLDKFQCTIPPYRQMEIDQMKREEDRLYDEWQAKQRQSDRDATQINNKERDCNAIPAVTTE